jgi:hypothetical protein
MMVGFNHPSVNFPHNASTGSVVVKHSPRIPKVEGLIPVDTESGREKGENGLLIFILK